MEYISSIPIIKKQIEANIGRHVIISSPIGRNKVLREEGIIENAHHNVFVISVNDEKRFENKKSSYMYTDILIKDIEVLIIQEDA